jgi:hypothetical protein
MEEYVKNICDETSETMGGISMTPAGAHLFMVNKINPKKLPTDKAEQFHHYTAKL